MGKVLFYVRMSTRTAYAKLLRDKRAITTADVTSSTHLDLRLALVSETKAERPGKLSQQGWGCLLSALGIDQQLPRTGSHLWGTWSEDMQGLLAGSGESLGCL